MPLRAPAALILTACLLGTVRAADPVNIIFDTDMGGDCDDVGALFILHGAVERGEAKLLATMGCISSDTIAPALDAINIWFGRPEIPVGTLKDPGFLPGPHYTAELARRFPHQFPSSKDYPDAVTLYRRILARQPDRSVVVVAVGPLRNMANLLKSAPDETSPLDGKALVAKKVKRLDVMGGTYPSSTNRREAEWNFAQDPASAALVCSRWPTPILFNGEGGSTNSGRRVTFEMPEHNPLTLAYASYPGVGFGGDRLSWDPISCLVSVRGPEPWYTLVQGGTNVIEAATGLNTWQTGEDRGHSYLVLKCRKAQVEKALEDLMVAGRGRPTKLVFNTASYASAGMCSISARGSTDAQSLPINAFDRDEKSVWQDRVASSWIECRYADGRAYRVTSYTVVARDPRRQPRTLELRGSNDGGVTWTTVDRQTAPGFTEQSTRREFTVNGPAKWNLYRLHLTAADENEGLQIATIELNEAIHCNPGTSVATVTLDRQTLSIPVNGRSTLNATLSPLDTWERTVMWESSNPSVADVRRIGEQAAVVIGRKTGTCTITSSIENRRQTCIVTVTPSTLPAVWSYDELNSPAVPGAVVVSHEALALTGCGHAMTSWWERVRDQGVYVNQPLAGDCSLSVRLTNLPQNVGGPSHPGDYRPPSVAGLMVRESLAESCGRYVLIQAEASGNLVCRWRDKTGDQDDNQRKELGKATAPMYLKLTRSGNEIQAFTSTDGEIWGEPKMKHPAAFDEMSRIGLFVCSGNTFVTTTAVFDSVKVFNPHRPHH